MPRPGPGLALLNPATNRWVGRRGEMVVVRKWKWEWKHETKRPRVRVPNVYILHNQPAGRTWPNKRRGNGLVARNCFVSFSFVAAPVLLCSSIYIAQAGIGSWPGGVVQPPPRRTIPPQLVCPYPPVLVLTPPLHPYIVELRATSRQAQPRRSFDLGSFGRCRFN